MTENLKMNNNLLIFAKYSFSYIAYAALAFAVFYILGFEFLATVSFFVVLFLMYTFRNPERELQNFDTASILSPCDGIVTSIEEIQNSDYSYKIEIESSFMDVGVLRHPINGEIKDTLLTRGVKVSKRSKLFSSLSESLVIEYIDAKQNSLKVVHQLKGSFFPIFSELKKGDKTFKSLRYGFASNALTTIYLKNNVRLDLQVGQSLKASESLIAYFS